MAERAPASAGEGGGSVVSTSSITKKKNNLKDISIYPNLEQHEELIRSFWRVKKGSKSEAGLEAPLYRAHKDPRDLRRWRREGTAMELAANGLWKGVSVRLYEQYKPTPKRTLAEQEPEMKHPAHRDFTCRPLIAAERESTG